MKNLHTFFAYYSFIIATCLLGWSLFISPRPLGYLLATLIFPISVYFWVLASGKLPHETNEASGSQHTLGLLITISLIIATASILIFFSLGNIQQDEKRSQQSPNIDKRLDRIQTSLSELDNTSLALEKLSMKVTLMQSALLRLEGKKDSKLIEDELQGILEVTPTATPEAIFTP